MVMVVVMVVVMVLVLVYDNNVVVNSNHNNNTNQPPYREKLHCILFTRPPQLVCSLPTRLLSLAPVPQSPQGFQGRHPTGLARRRRWGGCGNGG